MNNEFKKVKSNVSTDTRYVLEDGGMTSSGSIATVEKPLGELQRRVEPPKPRNFVAKNAKMGGAGAHKDKKKAEKQGDAKHKKPFSESVEDQTSYQVAKVLSSKGIKYDPAHENDLINAIGMVLVKELNMSPAQARSIIRSEDFLSDTMSELHHMAQSMEENAHPDEKEDKALIRKMVKHDSLKKEGYGMGSYATAMGSHIQPGNGPDVSEGEDDTEQEVGMAGSELYGIAKHAKELLALIHQQGQQQGLEAWQQSKITKAADYLTSVLQSLDYNSNSEKSVEEDNGISKDAETRFHTKLDRLVHNTFGKRKSEQGVAEATGDKPFDKMMTTIKQGTNKQKTADRKEQQKQTQQRARDAFGNMFGGGNPADKLKIREQGVAEGSEDLVQIEYWQQETMESGRWVKTKPIPRATAEKIVNSFERGEIVDVEQGVAEGYDEWNARELEKSRTRHPDGTGSTPSKTLAKLMRIPGFSKVSPAEQQRVAKAVDRYLARDMSFDQALVLAQKKGVAEGAPELLKKEMPLHRHAEKLLAQNGVSKDDPDYHHHLGNTIKHLRQFGNIDLINKQGVAEAGYGRNRGYSQGFASPNAPSLGSRPNHGDDERHDLDDYELQQNRQEVTSYNITIDGKPINPKPIFGRSATIAWGKEQAAAGVDLSNAKMSPVRYTEDAYMESLHAMLERSVSQAQHNLMVGVAHNPQFAQKVKVKQKVGKEFSDADAGHDISKLPIRVPKKK